MDLIQITKENLAKEHICCAISIMYTQRGEYTLADLLE